MRNMWFSVLGDREWKNEDDQRRYQADAGKYQFYGPSRDVLHLFYLRVLLWLYMVADLFERRIQHLGARYQADTDT